MNKLRVLVAHSQKRTLQQTDAVFRRFHTLEWVVTPATDGSEALFKANNTPFDLIVIERDLQKVSSDRVLTGLRGVKEMSEIPIIWLGTPERNWEFEDEVQKKKVICIADPKDSRALLDAVVTCLNLISSRKQEPFRITALQAGQYLMRAGDVADQVFILKSGRLKASLLKDDGETILGFVEPGEFVGEMAYLNGERRSADVIAEQLSELIAIPITQFEATLANRPSWGVAMMKVLAKRLKKSNLFGAKKETP